jgi:hypothetical protein
MTVEEEEFAARTKGRDKHSEECLNTFNLGVENREATALKLTAEAESESFEK